MFKSRSTWVLLLSWFSTFLGYGTKSPSTASNESSTISITAIGDSSHSTVGPIREQGLLKQVEDSGYPYFTLTIDFPERKFEESFAMNVEEIGGWDAGTLSAAVGKYVSFEYYSEVTNALLDLRYQGKSLLGDDGLGVADEHTKSITGVLSGAEEVTKGDLPGMLFISTAEEYFETFNYFITPEMVAANGKVVEGVYEKRTYKTIVSLEVID